MRIGRKIALGYAAVIGIAVIIGLITVFSMQSVRGEIEQLDNVHLPAMRNGSAVERNAWALFFHMRGYSSTYDKAELASARRSFDAVEEAVREGAALSAAHDLAEFSELDGATAHTLNRYGELMNQSEKAINTMVAQRGPLNSASERFGSSCDEFLKEQTADLAESVHTRQNAIVLAQEIVDHGTQARVLSFEAQSSNNYSLFADAKEQLEAVFAKTEQLAASLTATDEVASIEEIKASAQSYADAIDDYFEQVSDEEDIDVMAMMQSRQAMEASAASFSVATKEFLQAQNEGLEESVAKRLALVNQATTVLGQGNRISTETLRAQAELDRGLLSNNLEAFSAVYEGIAEIRGLTVQAEDLDFLARIESAAKDFEGAMRSYLQAWDALENADSERVQAYQEVIRNAERMAEVGIEAAVESSNRNAGKVARATSVTVFSIVAAIALAVVLAFFGVRSITAALRALVRQLNTTAGSVSSASGQVSQASQELAEGSSQQAASVEETSSSLEELASMTRQNAEHAGNANTTVQSTAEVVSEATQAMNELTASMREIADGSKETQKIIKTIDEIAFQTNLLALNAAVEAARAGEAGAGFAVVADEVRNLAIRAAEAARNTAGLIENSVNKIDVGASLLSRTNEAFERVSSQTNEVRDLIASIATASGEQSNGIEQINKAVSEMDRVVQRNASGAEETASAASELSTQAVNLDRVVEELNALLDGQGRSGAANGSRDAGAYGEAEVDEDEFRFDLPDSTADADEPGRPSKVTTTKPSPGARAAGASEGVIRDSEMAHEDFEFDDTDFNFDDDSFDSPKR